MNHNSYHLCLARTFLQKHLPKEKNDELEIALAETFAITESIGKEEEKENCIDILRSIRANFSKEEQRIPCSIAINQINQHFQL